MSRASPIRSVNHVTIAHIAGRQLRGGARMNRLQNGGGLNFQAGSNAHTGSPVGQRPISQGLNGGLVISFILER